MMAMEINGNYYNSYAAQNMAGSSAVNGAKKKETEKTQETAEVSKSKSTAAYANELAKLVPSAAFKIGNSYSTAKTGITRQTKPRHEEEHRHVHAQIYARQYRRIGIRQPEAMLHHYKNDAQAFHYVGNIEPGLFLHRTAKLHIIGHTHGQLDVKNHCGGECATNHVNTH